MFHVGEEKGETWPYNVRSIQCPPSQFSDVNTFRLIYSRTGLHPLRASLLTPQSLVFKMDFNTTTVTITKVIASEGLCLCFSWEHVSPRWKGLFYPEFNYVTIPPTPKSQKLHAHVFLRGEKKWAAVCRMYSSLQSPPGSFHHQALSQTEVAWLAHAVCVCCLLKQCYPTASAESVSAVLMLCQGETPGRRLLHQPFLLFNRTMNTGC